LSKIPAFIIMFNRLTWPKQMAEFLSDTGCEVFLVDNGSTYPDLLEWYKNCPYKIYKLNANFGHHVIWTCRIIENNHPNEAHYIATDHDLDLSNVPKDYLDLLLKEVELYDDIFKAGLSLEIKDLPKNEFTDKIINFENHFWDTPRGNNGFYAAEIDTTLALYKSRKSYDRDNFYKAVRSPRPYTARHLPWYMSDQLVNEEYFYRKNINADIKSCNSSHWLNK